MNHTDEEHSETMGVLKSILTIGVFAEILFVGIMIFISIPILISFVYGTPLAIIFAVFTALEAPE